MTEQDLSGRVALVTGSSRGLGRHYALRLAACGADVAIHDVDTKAASRFGESDSFQQTVDEVRAAGRRSSFFGADLTYANEVAQMVDDVIETFGHIDIVINNAGGDIGAQTDRPEPNDALDIADEDIDSVVQRNVFTTMYTCKYVGRHMRDRRSGKIVNVGSVAGHVAARNGLIYAAAKAANAHYTRCLAEQLRPFDVNVNCIAPAPTYTGRFLATREVADQAERSRLQQVAEPEEMGSIMLFLAGPLSDHLTGETIVCW